MDANEADGKITGPPPTWSDDLSFWGYGLEPYLQEAESKLLKAVELVNSGKCPESVLQFAASIHWKIDEARMIHDNKGPLEISPGSALLAGIRLATLIQQLELKISEIEYLAYRASKGRKNRRETAQRLNAEKQTSNDRKADAERAFRKVKEKHPNAKKTRLSELAAKELGVSLSTFYDWQKSGQ